MSKRNREHPGKFLLEAELTLENVSTWGLQNPDEYQWFVEDVLTNGINLLHNNDPIGDEVGFLKITSVREVESAPRNL